MFNRGTTNLFGGANTSFGGFGAAAATPFSAGTTGGFGSTGFGATATPTGTTGGLFGSAGSSGGGLFGQQNANKPTGFTFGTQNVAAVQPTTGLFGSTGATTGFGGAAVTPQQSPFGGGLFGGGAVGGASAVVGTTVKFNPVVGSDVMMKNNQQQTVTTKLQCITGMKDYETKSLEELRLEDYMANRKGPQPGSVVTGFGTTQQTSQATAGFGGFGGFSGVSSAPTVFGQPQAQQTQAMGGLFGAGAQSKPLFGPTTTTAAPTTGLFGSNTTGGMFGAQNKPNLFGTTATSQPAGFGQPAAGGLFGTTPATGTVFGAPQASQPSGGLFGTPAAATATPFGTANQTSNLFGAKPAGTGFGIATTSAPGGGFGGFGAATAQPTLNLGTASGGLFGAKPTASAPAFGVQSAAPTFPSFNTPAVNTGLGTGGFGTTGGLGLGTGTGLFNQNRAAAPTAFGQTNFSFNTPSVGTNLLGGGALTTTVPAGSQPDAAQAAALAQQQQLIQQQVSILNSSPYGDSPLFRNLRQSDGATRREALLRPTNPLAQKSALEAGPQFKVQTRMTAKVKPTPIYSAASGKGQLFDGLEDEDVSYNTSLNNSRRSVKKLVIKSSSANHSNASHTQDSERPAELDTSRPINRSPSGGLGGRSGVVENGSSEGGGWKDLNISRSQGSVAAGTSPQTAGTTGASNTYQNGAVDTTVTELVGRGSRQYSEGQRGAARAREGRSSEARGRSFSYEADNSSEDFSSEDAYARNMMLGMSDDNSDESAGVLKVVVNVDHSVVVGPCNGHVVCLLGADHFRDLLILSYLINVDDGPPHKAGIKLRRPGYYTAPSLEELEGMVGEDGSCWVKNFVIGRENFGCVSFPGDMDVSGLDLDDLVHFRSKEIDIYPNDDQKPPEGSGLNRPAQVTLDRVWPVDKSTGEVIKDYARLQSMHYMEKLERASFKIGAKFIDYRPETGSWVFEVAHFSKYKLPDNLDDDDDENVPPEVKLQKLQESLQQKSAAAAAAAIQQQKVGLMDESAGDVGYVPGSWKKPLSAPVLDDDDDDSYMMDGVTGGTRINKELSGARLSSVVQDKSAAKKSVLLEEEVEEDDEMDNDDNIEYMERTLGVSSRQVQLQKASFFGHYQDDEDEDDVMRGFDDDDDVMEELKRKNVRAGFTRHSVGFVKASPQTFLVDSSLKRDRRSLMPFDKRPTASPDIFSKTFAGGLTSDKPVSSPRVKAPGLEISGLPNDSGRMVPSGLALEGPSRGLVGCRVDKALQPYTLSLLAGREGVCMDAGLVHGRAFRAGWATNWMVAQVGRPLVSDKDVEMDTDNSGIGLMKKFSGHMTKRKSMRGVEPKISDWQLVSLNTVNVGCSQQDNEMLTSCLLLALASSDFRSEAGGPMFYPRQGLELLSSYNQNLTKPTIPLGYSLMMTEVWGLCWSLWGEVGGKEGCEDYVIRLARREALSQWLTNTSKQSVYLHVKHNIDKGVDSADSVFSYLTGRLVEEACECAEGSRDLRLALLVAQASSCQEFRILLRQQLSAWADNKMDGYIDVDRLKIVALLSGLIVWQTSHQKINVCEGLDWKRCLAIHLWYNCSCNTSIEEALESYESACGCSLDKDDEPYAVLPSPEYLEELGLTDSKVYDVTYHLLKLYSDRTHPLNLLLNPHTMTGNQLDYSLSFHLMGVLESLGYAHISSEHHSYICHSYAAQLEAAGLYQWAAFVLLHIKHAASRMDGVRKLLSRHVSVGGSETEEEEERLRFMIEQLHIPAQWIHAAKSIRAQYTGDRLQEAWHLMKAEQWNKCHTIIMQHIASDAIVNDNEDLLKLYLTPLVDVSPQIKDWVHGGLLYLDYFTLRHKNQNFPKDEEEEGDRGALMIEELESLSYSMIQRLPALQATSSIDRVSRAKIAKCVADVVTLLTDLGTQDIRLTVDQLDGLLLTEDDARSCLTTITQISCLNNFF